MGDRQQQRGSEVRRMAGGFSLVELLVVMGGVGLLLAAVAGFSGDLVGGARLGGDGAELVARLGTARQLAVTLNRPVQVRIYGWQEGEGGPTWGGVQIWEGLGGAGGYRARDELWRPSEGVAVMGEERFSSLLGLEAREVWDGEGPGLLETRYVAFDFLPGGSTDLPTAGEQGGMHWHLTLVRARGLGHAGTGLPRDFLVVQVDPLTGAVRLLRP